MYCLQFVAYQAREMDMLNEREPLHVLDQRRTDNRIILASLSITFSLSPQRTFNHHLMTLMCLQGIYSYLLHFSKAAYVLLCR